METPIVFPLRLNRYLATRGFATRPGADDLIRQGAVRLNGRIAKLGDKVTGPEDVIEVSPETGNRHLRYRYVAYYKPQGVITHSPQGSEQSIGEISGFPGLFPLGRLDKASEGLILLTDDGRVTERLLHPRFAHEKRYEVTVRETVPPGVVRLFKTGVRSQGEWLKAKRTLVTGARTLVVVLTEGRKHQIRRMLDAARLTVVSLKRVSIMGVHLGALRPGEARELRGPARQAFLAGLNL